MANLTAGASDNQVKAKYDKWVDDNASRIDIVTVEQGGYTWEVHPTVFCPNISYHFMEIVPYPKGPDSRMVDIGSGCGLLAVHAALMGVSRVIATDVVPAAKANIDANARRHGVSDKVEARVSDVFSAFNAGEKFDLIFWNYPFVPDNTGRDYSTISDVEKGIRDPGQMHLKAYCEGARALLKRGGRLLITYSGTMGDMDTFVKMTSQTGWKPVVLHDLSAKGPQVQLYELVDQESTTEDVVTKEVVQGAKIGCVCCYGGPKR